MPRVSRKKMDAIRSGVVSGLSWTAAKKTNLYLEAQVLERGKSIVAYNKRIPLRRNTIMVFADDAPGFNWAHPCRYLLHDAKSGEFYREVKAQFPPYLRADAPKTFKAFHEPVRLATSERHYPILPLLRCPIYWSAGDRYAVLFAGGANNRHTNDLEFLYRTLIDIYGFSASNVYVLNYDGTINYSGNPKPVGNWPGDSTAYRMPVNGQGTKSALDSVFNTLKGKLSKSDLLFIHTNNHGGHNGTESYLCTYSGADYMASAFAAKLATLPKFHCLMVMMEQCHSGGFNGPILAQSPATYTSVSSACEELRSSIGGPEFDPFARDWIAAMTGSTPYGGTLASNPDSDGSGKVSAAEAHDYADAVKHSYDTPVYSESSATAGACHLGRRWYVWRFYCRILLEKLYPYYVKWPRPEFYEVVHHRLMPELAEIQKKLEHLSDVQQEELSEALGRITKEIMVR